MNRAVLRSVVAALVVLAAVLPCGARGETLLVYSAASLTNALTDAGEVCAGPDTVKLSFASSSVLAKQIAHGAPAHIYLSANEQWMSYLASRDLLEPGTRRTFAGNRLVAIVPADSTLPATADLGAGLARLGAGDRIAMGDPDHVPAGIYARAALEHLGLWDEVRGRAARSATVRAALALVETGAAPLGIVYRTDAAVSRRVRVVEVLPADSHPPVVYEAAIVRGAATPAAVRLLDCLTGSKAFAAFQRYGFAPPPTALNADAR